MIFRANELRVFGDGVDLVRILWSALWSALDVIVYLSVGNCRLGLYTFSITFSPLGSVLRLQYMKIAARIREATNPLLNRPIRAG